MIVIYSYGLLHMVSSTLYVCTYISVRRSLLVEQFICGEIIYFSINDILILYIFILESTIYYAAIVFNKHSETSDTLAKKSYSDIRKGLFVCFEEDLHVCQLCPYTF